MKFEEAAGEDPRTDRWLRRSAEGLPIPSRGVGPFVGGASESDSGPLVDSEAGQAAERRLEDSM